MWNIGVTFKTFGSCANDDKTLLVQLVPLSKQMGAPMVPYPTTFGAHFTFHPQNFIHFSPLQLPFTPLQIIICAITLHLTFTSTCKSTRKEDQENTKMQNKSTRTSKLVHFAMSKTTQCETCFMMSWGAKSNFEPWWNTLQLFHVVFVIMSCKLSKHRFLVLCLLDFIDN